MTTGTDRATPSTEAGRRLVEDEPRVVTGEHDMRTRVLAIEEQARAEGRQEAVRETGLKLSVEQIRAAIGEVKAGTQAESYVQAAAMSMVYIMEHAGVAGLNTSEPPLTRDDLDALNRASMKRVAPPMLAGDASESPGRVALRPLEPADPIVVEDASESPPPLPDAHRLGGLIERAIRESRRKNGLLPDGWTLVEMALAYPPQTPTEPSESGQPPEARDE